jgi:transposase
VLALHAARAGFVKARTAQANQIRGLLAEFGLVIPQGIPRLYQRVPALIERAEASLPGRFRVLVERLLDHLRLLDRQVQELEREIVGWLRESNLSRRIDAIVALANKNARVGLGSVGFGSQVPNERSPAGAKRIASFAASAKGPMPKGRRRWSTQRLPERVSAARRQKA